MSKVVFITRGDNRTGYFNWSFREKNKLFGMIEPCDCYSAFIVHQRFVSWSK